MSTMPDTQIGDMTNPKIREGVYNLIAAVIGEAIKPDKTRRLASGRMNRPEERGGETEAWLNSNAGKYWLKLADLTGIINSKAIIAIAQDTDKDKVGRYIEGDVAVQ
ncbi:MAG: hypothetical protein CFH43_00563 [Proteobacteria bacterium]|nr:MAG: hypothetical protein CFH43_00563 [Pseudomonadota bacterium]